MNVYDFSNILSAFADAGMSFLLFEAFLQRRSRLPAAAYFGGMVVLSVAICICNYYLMFQFFNVVGMALLTIIASSLYRGHLGRKLTVIFVSMLLSLILEVVMTALLTLGLHTTVEEVTSIPTYRLFGVLSSKISGLAVCNVIRVKKQKAKLELKSAYWLIFLFLYLSFLSVTFLLFRLSYALHTTTYNLEIMLCTFFLLGSIVLLLFLYERQSQQSMIMREKEQYEQQLKFQLNHLEDLLARQRALRKFKHDLSHQMTGLRAYLQTGDTASALRHLDALSAHIATGTPAFDTGNTALDAILSTKKQRAESKGIAFTAKLRLQENIPTQPEDVCTIFGNALDNAIEACERLGEGQTREIILSLVQIEDQLLCKIVNTAPVSTNNNYATSKADAINHGFGLVNLRESLAKYDCTPEITWQDGQFTLRFALPLKKSPSL